MPCHSLILTGLYLFILHNRPTCSTEPSVTACPDPSVTTCPNHMLYGPTCVDGVAVQDEVVLLVAVQQLADAIQRVHHQAVRVGLNVLLRTHTAQAALTTSVFQTYRIKEYLVSFYYVLNIYFTIW